MIYSADSIILICNSHGATSTAVIFSTAFSEAATSTDIAPPVLDKFGSKPQFARIVDVFTDALTMARFPVKVSYSVLLTRPGVNNAFEPKPNRSGTIDVIPPQPSAVRLTEGSGHVEFDITVVLIEALYGWNSMIAGDTTCRTEMHVKYKNTEIVAEVDAVNLVCRHKVRMAAPSPLQASDMSCIVVSLWYREREADNASR